MAYGRCRKEKKRIKVILKTLWLKVNTRWLVKKRWKIHTDVTRISTRSIVLARLR